MGGACCGEPANFGVPIDGGADRGGDCGIECQGAEWVVIDDQVVSIRVSAMPSMRHDQLCSRTIERTI